MRRSPGKKILEDRIHERALELHRKKLASLRPGVNNSPPREFTHIQMNLKRLQTEEERLSKIEHDNDLLLGKMASMGRKRGIDQSPPRHRAMDKYGEKERLAQQIYSDNQDLLHRIQSASPTYSRARWEQNHVRQQEYLKNICEFPVLAPDVPSHDPDELLLAARERREAQDKIVRRIIVAQGSPQEKRTARPSGRSRVLPALDGTSPPTSPDAHQMRTMRGINASVEYLHGYDDGDMDHRRTLAATRFASSASVGRSASPDVPLRKGRFSTGSPGVARPSSELGTVRRSGSPLARATSPLGRASSPLARGESPPVRKGGRFGPPGEIRAPRGRPSPQALPNYPHPSGGVRPSHQTPTRSSGVVNGTHGADRHEVGPPASPVRLASPKAQGLSGRATPPASLDVRPSSGSASAPTTGSPLARAGSPLAPDRPGSRGGARPQTPSSPGHIAAARRVLSGGSPGMTRTQSDSSLPSRPASPSLALTVRRGSEEEVVGVRVPLEGMRRVSSKPSVALAPKATEVITAEPVVDPRFLPAEAAASMSPAERALLAAAADVARGEEGGLPKASSTSALRRPRFLQGPPPDDSPPVRGVAARQASLASHGRVYSSPHIGMAAAKGSPKEAAAGSPKARAGTPKGTASPKGIASPKGAASPKGTASPTASPQAMTRTESLPHVRKSPSKPSPLSIVAPASGATESSTRQRSPTKPPRVASPVARTTPAKAATPKDSPSRAGTPQDSSGSKANARRALNGDFPPFSHSVQSPPESPLRRWETVGDVPVNVVPTRNNSDPELIGRNTALSPAGLGLAQRAKRAAEADPDADPLNTSGAALNASASSVGALLDALNASGGKMQGFDPLNTSARSNASNSSQMETLAPHPLLRTGSVESVRSKRRRMLTGGPPPTKSKGALDDRPVSAPEAVPFKNSGVAGDELVRVVIFGARSIPRANHRPKPEPKPEPTFNSLGSKNLNVPESMGSNNLNIPESQGSRTSEPSLSLSVTDIYQARNRSLSNPNIPELAEEFMFLAHLNETIELEIYGDDLCSDEALGVVSIILAEIKLDKRIDLYLPLQPFKKDDASGSRSDRSEEGDTIQEVHVEILVKLQAPPPSSRSLVRSPPSSLKSPGRTRQQRPTVEV